MEWPLYPDDGVMSGTAGYCTRCGAETPPSAQSCVACGAPVLGAGDQGGIGSAAVSSPPVAPSVNGRDGDARGSPRRGLVVGTLTILLVLAVGIGVFLVTRSSDNQQSSPVTTNAPSATTTPRTVRTANCTSVNNGYTIEYPGDWFAEAADPVWSCALFDPQRFTLEPDTETPHVAVQIYDERTITFDATVTSVTDPSSYDVLRRQDTTVDGRPAIVLETVQLTDDFLPAGTYSYQYVVDRSGGIVLAFTTGQPGSPFDQYRSTLDDMMASLRFTG